MDALLYEVTDGIGRITFNRPAARNALTIAMYGRLGEICGGMAASGPVRALILAGAGGRAFAAGTDMAEFRGFSGPQDALGYEAEMDRVLGAVERCPVPTIAAIEGACTGGGAAIAACCDLRLVGRDLKFGFPIARTLGNCLSGANLARLTELIGVGRVKEMLFTARLIGADEAQAIGLAAEIAEDPPARALELAGTLAAHAPLTLRATKEALRRNRAALADDSDLIELCYMSADFKEGVEAFLAKRPPRWRGA